MDGAVLLLLVTWECATTLLPSTGATFDKAPGIFRGETTATTGSAAAAGRRRRLACGRKCMWDARSVVLLRVVVWNGRRAFPS